MKKKTALIAIIFLICFQISGAQYSTDYYSRYHFLMGPPGAFNDGLAGDANPAVLALLNGFESRFFWSTDGLDASSFDNWGLFLGVPNLGFGVQRYNYGDFHVTDYRLSTAIGSQSRMFGFGYGWTTGNKHEIGRKRLVSLGALTRPCRYFSMGLVGNFSLEDDWNEGIAEVGIRPLGTPRLTLFADGAIERDMKFSDAPWSAGASIQVFPGLDLIGRYFESEAFTLGFTFNFGRAGLGGQSHYDGNQDHIGNSYHLRLGSLRPSVIPGYIDAGNRYLPLNLKGRVDYQKYVFFDKETLRFADILNNIKAAASDPRVAVIALNLSDLHIYGEHAWEIRQELIKAKSAGKKVVAFFDRAEMTNYHLASAADLIVMDPQGDLMVGGYVLGRTYLKGTLDKLGLGFDEWRFFKYKSAPETYSRTNMSDADREQRQAYVDDLYDLVRDDICQSRNLTSDQYEKIINDQGFLMSDEAIAAGLVDTVGRWSDNGKIISRFMGQGMGGISASDLMDNALYRDTWGPMPQIAVVYGLGECAMDKGIRARWLERVFKSLARKKSIKAVVFRVDSPGGDGMASDLVAEALRECAKSKPVIISQGQVAGSGGYWISMYGDEIIAGPNTVTGSIGVYGGWLYDKGFSQKLGMTSDHVQRGKHADLRFGVTLPYLGLRIPARNLNDEEYARMKKLILAFYDEFVQRVAAGRHMPVEKVMEIAQGHFYSGLNGKKVGLVDKIGGLEMAIALARDKSGIDPEKEVEIIEIPKYKGLFRFDLFPDYSPIAAKMIDADIYRYLKAVTEHNGRPLPMMVPGTYPFIE